MTRGGAACGIEEGELCGFSLDCMDITVKVLSSVVGMEAKGGIVGNWLVKKIKGVRRDNLANFAVAAIEYRVIEARYGDYTPFNSQLVCH